MWQYQDWGQIIYLCANTNTRVLEHLCVCARADVYIYIYKILPGDMVLSVHIHVVWNGARIICDIEHLTSMTATLASAWKVNHIKEFQPHHLQ